MFLKYGFFGRRLNKRAGKRPNAKSSNRRRRSVAIDKKKSYWVGFFSSPFYSEISSLFSKVGERGGFPWTRGKKIEGEERGRSPSGGSRGNILIYLLG